MLDSIFSSVSGVVVLIILALVVVIAAILSTWKKIPADKAAVIVGLGTPQSCHRGRNDRDPHRPADGCDHFGKHHV